MEWVGLNRYSLSSILNALNNKKLVVKDNLKLPVFMKSESFKTAIILGGGESAKTHLEAIQKYTEINEDICLIHAGVRNVSSYLDSNCKQFYSLVGVESDKLMKQFADPTKLPQTCIFPPYPRKMGTSIPFEIEKISKELESIEFTTASMDSPLVISIQVAIDLGVEEIYLVGFDGYDVSLNHDQFVLAQENQNIINDILKQDKISVKSLTPTKYEHIQLTSIYSFLK
jgi:4-hydroxy 2-oxovalerate aldolase